MMSIYNNSIQLGLSIILMINALSFILQSIKTLKEKTAQDISLFTFIGLLCTQTIIMAYSIILRHSFLIASSTFGMISCLISAMLILFYNKNNSSKKNDSDLQEILRQFPGHIYCKNREGILTRSNRYNFPNLELAYSKNKEGKTDYDFFPKEDADQFRKTDEKVLRTGQLQIKEESVTLNGNTLIYLSYKAPLKNKKNQTIGIIGVSVDITEAKKAIDQKVAILENVISVMPGHVYWIDRKGFYLGCNNNQAKSIGLKSRKDIIGKRNKDIPGFLIPEALDPVNQQVMETGKSVTAEEPALLDNKEAVFLSSKVPLRNIEGEVEGLVGISIDITERKKLQKSLEEARIQEKIQEEKINALKTFGYSIAHELRTPISSIVISSIEIKKFLPLLVKGYQKAQDAKLLENEIYPLHLELLKKGLIRIKEEGEAANTIINMFLINMKKSEIDKSTFTTLSIADCLNKAMTRYSFQKNQSRLIHLDTTNDFTFISNEILSIHIIFNLLKNALHYIEKANKGAIYISLKNLKQTNQLIFKDTGTGIPNDIAPKIFDRFFTKTESGAGLGLSFCKEVMKSIGGSISCNSTEGEFTEFVLTFPILTENQNIN